VLLLLPLLAACGSESDDPGQPPAEADPELVQMLVLTSAGGEVGPQPYLVDDRDQMQDYVKTFEDRDDVAAAIQQAVKDAEDRPGVLAVATVAIGCDVPDEVNFSKSGEVWEVTPGKIPDPLPECFAPTTSIALVELP